MGIQTGIRAALAAIAAAQPELTATIRYAGEDVTLTGSIDSVICTGLDKAKTVTEEGLIDEAGGSIRYSSLVEPAAWAVLNVINGKVIEVLQNGKSEWLRCRVIGRRETAGTVLLTVVSEFAET